MIEKLKKKVDNYNDEKVDDEIKRQIKISLGHANYPLKKRIYELYKSEEKELDKYIEWLKNKFKIDFSNIGDIINETVDYRNNNTHNSFGLLNEKVLNGVTLFNAIIYSKVLKEIGILNENISDILIMCLR